MANPNTYPSDGRLTTLQNFTGTIGGTELMEIVSPGNASLGINYNITTQQVAAGLLNVLPPEPPNEVLAGPASGTAAGTATFRALVLADLPAINNSTILGNASGTTAVPAALTQSQAAGVAMVGTMTTPPQRVNLAVAGDTPIPITFPPGFTQFRLQGLNISQPSAPATAATIGLYTASAAGGTLLLSSGTTAITLTTNATNTNNNYQAITSINLATEVFTPTAGFLYFHVVATAAATVSLSLTYFPIA